MQDEKQIQEEMRRQRDSQELLGVLHERGTREGWMIDKAEVSVLPVLGFTDADLAVRLRASF